MEQVKAEPVAWVRELVAEGLWHRKRKALDLPAEYLPSSRTDFMDEAATIVSNATPQPAAVDGLVEAARDARRIIAEIDDYMKRPERGDWGTECACCMGELLDDDRETIARIDQALAQIERKPEDVT